MHLFTFTSIDFTAKRHMVMRFSAFLLFIAFLANPALGQETLLNQNDPLERNLNKWRTHSPEYGAWSQPPSARETSPAESGPSTESSHVFGQEESQQDIGQHEWGVRPLRRVNDCSECNGVCCRQGNGKLQCRAQSKGCTGGETPVVPIHGLALLTLLGVGYGIYKLRLA